MRLNADCAGQLILLGALLMLSLPCAAQEKTNWSITPYIWASKTTYDLKADGSPLETGTVSFSDLLDTTDTSFQIVVEAGRDQGNWSFMTDVTYIETSDDNTFEVGDVGSVRIDTESEQIHADIAVSFWPWAEAGGLSLIGGIRYTDLDDDTAFSVVVPELGRIGNLRIDRDFTDALVGARYIVSMSERWKLHSRADYGFGDSEGIFQAHLLVRYAVGSSKNNGIMIGYRYKESEFEDGGLEEEYEYKGPVIGFNIRL